MLCGKDNGCVLRQLGVNMHRDELVAETTAALTVRATRRQGCSGMGPRRGMACKLQGCGCSSELLEHESCAYAIAMACLCSCVASLCAVWVLLGLLALECSLLEV